VTIGLTSGIEWEEDPDPNANSHGGRTIRRDMRGKGKHSSTLVIVKRPQPQYMPSEMYSIGMERVAFALADELGLPVPDTWLETVDGHPSSVQRRISAARSWRQLQMMMRDNIVNRDLWALAALFDVWIGNVDRRDVNFLFEPIPAGATPPRAQGSRMWLIDHGMCGLWPAGKLDPMLGADDVPDAGAKILSGALHQTGEARIFNQMPVEYRQALKRTAGNPSRVELLDRVRGVSDDAIEQTVGEIPEEYISAGRAEATVAFLKARRDALDTVAEQYW
jgi:hypothetical protein